MGVLNPYVGQIREIHLDHAIAYFCHGTFDRDDASQVRMFLNGFVASFPEALEPAEGVTPAATVSAGQVVMQPALQLLLPLSLTSLLNV